MNRTRRAFERRFRELLGELGARQRDKGLAWLFSRRRSNGRSLTHAFAEENITLAEKVQRFRRRKGKDSAFASPPVIICDAGLGGLARWLRASGYEALWTQDITDEELVTQAAEIGATVITTDSLLLERRVITQGNVRAVWVPATLTKFEQLRL